MSINKETLDYLAELSNIELRSEDVPRYIQNLNQLLGILDALQGVDVASYSTDISLDHEHTYLLRKDVITEQPHVKELQQLASDTTQGFYLVPKVIEGE